MMQVAKERMSLAERIKARARELGFELVGIAGARSSAHLARLRVWLEHGWHGEMAYLARPDAVRRRGDLGLTMGGVRSVIVVAQEYYAADPPHVPGDASVGVIARYARGSDYHKLIKKRLQKLHGWIEDQVGGPVAGRAYVDTGPILERELGQRAGLGWFGKNTMLIHPKRGSYFFLGVLLLGIDLPADEPFAEEHCGSCRRCLDACPTGALEGYGPDGAPIMDARLCISYLTIEHRGPMRRALRPLIGNRIFGCDICQEVCPWNGEKFVRITREPAFQARPGERVARGHSSGLGAEAAGARPDMRALGDAGDDAGALGHGDRTIPGTDGPRLIELMGMSEEEWDAFSRGSAIRRAQRAGFLRNVAVALGNWGSPAAVPALARALSDAERLVRGHAAWALGRIGTEAAQAALRARRAVEPDGWVREEIELAISQIAR